MSSTDRVSSPKGTTAELLLHGEPVSVILVATEQNRHEIVKGPLIGIDEIGVLVEQGDQGWVFIPWSSVRTIHKPRAH